MIKNTNLILNIDNKLIYLIKIYINDNDFLKSKFYHSNNKYNIDDLLSTRF